MIFSPNESIDILGLSVRTVNCLKRNKIFTVRQLVNVPINELATFKNMGAKTLEEITDLLNNIFDENAKTVNQENVDTFNNSIIANSLNNLEMSNRLRNRLVQMNIYSVDELLAFPMEEWNDVKGLGQKTIDEVINLVQSLSVNYSNALGATDDGFGYTEEIKSILDVVITFYKLSFSEIKELKNAIYEKDIKETDEFITLLYALPGIGNKVEKEILDILDSKYNGISISDINSNFPEKLIKKTYLKNILNYMLAENQLIFDDSKYIIKYPSVMEYVDVALKDRQKQIVLERFTGKTLEEVGELYGVTRERVRQIIAKAFVRKPKLAENRYIEVFEQYEISKEEFCKIFDQPDSTFYYLETICNIRGLTRKPLIKILEDTNVSVFYKKRAEGIIYKDYITVDTGRIPKSRPEVFDYIVKTFCKDVTPYSEVIELYNLFLEEHNLSGDPKLEIEFRTYENKAAISNNVLWNMHRNMRYYNIFSRDYTDFVSEINISQYMNKEITSLKLFRDNRNLMEEYDIRDGYELHNLLKKIWDKYGDCPDVVFNKMPTISIGEIDIKKQVVDLLVRNTPVANTELAELYEESYGVKAATAMGNHFRHISEYFHDGIYELPEKIMPEYQVVHLRQVLSKDFYTMEEIHSIIKREYPDIDNEFITSYNLKQLGFNLYVNYVVKDIYLSAAAYFRYIITKDDIVNLKDFHHGILGTNSFTSEMYDMRQNRIITEFEPRRLINIRRLNAVGVTIATLEDYCEKVKEFTYDYEYFTIRKIRRDGFYHELDELGFNDWFYSSVLIADLKTFRYNRSSNTHIISMYDRKPSLAGLIERILLKEEKIELYDLINMLEDEYGIVQERHQIVEEIKATSLYYDSIMETVYIDYDTYFEEI